MSKSSDFSLLDLLNGAIYSKVQSEFLTEDQCQVIFHENHDTIVEAYKSCLRGKFRSASSGFENPLLGARLLFLQSVILKAF